MRRLWISANLSLFGLVIPGSTAGCAFSYVPCHAVGIAPLLFIDKCICDVISMCRRSVVHYYKNVDLSRLGNRCCPGFPTGNASLGQKGTPVPVSQPGSQHDAMKTISYQENN